MSKSKQSRRKFLSKQFKTIESRALDNFVRWGRTNGLKYLWMKIRASGLRGHEAELLRVRGAARLLGRSADPDRAGRDLEAALEIAREQGARAFELRSALSLTKLYRSTGCPLKAQALLVGVIEGFLPTPKFPEIAEVRTLLGALA